MDYNYKKISLWEEFQTRPKRSLLGSITTTIFLALSIVILFFYQDLKALQLFSFSIAIWLLMTFSILPMGAVAYFVFTLFDFIRIKQTKPLLQDQDLGKLDKEVKRKPSRRKGRYQLYSDNCFQSLAAIAEIESREATKKLINYAQDSREKVRDYALIALKIRALEERAYTLTDYFRNQGLDMSNHSLLQNDSTQTNTPHVTDEIKLVKGRLEEEYSRTKTIFISIIKYFSLVYIVYSGISSILLVLFDVFSINGIIIVATIGMAPILIFAALVLNVVGLYNTKFREVRRGMVLNSIAILLVILMMIYYQLFV